MSESGLGPPWPGRATFTQMPRSTHRIRVVRGPELRADSDGRGGVPQSDVDRVTARKRHQISATRQGGTDDNFTTNDNESQRHAGSRDRTLFC
jgi:hypothetical protein